MELAQGTIVADRFRLERKLGQGAMGMVWQAQHTGLDIPCAVKFIRAEVASLPEVRSRFEREAKAAAQLRSPHVVQILDHGVWEDLPYMAMEFLEGEDLAARLDREGRIDPHAVIDIMTQLARALSKAHAMGLIHRDLKPANIFLARDGNREIAKILDFGIVKDVSAESQTRVGSLMGTPYYMSPEQARSSKSVDHRADLWSLGVVVYRCLTGKLPFEVAQSVGELLMQILSAPLPVPSQVAQVPPGFDAWWARAASRDPAQRFQSADEFVEALTAALDTPATAPFPGQEMPHSAQAYAAAPMYPPPPSMMQPGYPAAKPRASNTLLYIGIGVFGLAVLLTLGGLKRSATAAKPAIECAAVSQGYACKITQKANTKPAEVCWDVKVKCADGSAITGSKCRNILPTEKAVVVIPDSQFKGKKCENEVDFTVQNVRMGPPNTSPEPPPLPPPLEFLAVPGASIEILPAAGWTHEMKDDWLILKSSDKQVVLTFVAFERAVGSAAKLGQAPGVVSAANIKWGPPKPTTLGPDKLPAQTADGPCSFNLGDGIAIYATVTTGEARNVLVVQAMAADANPGTQGIAAAIAASIRKKR